MIRKFIVITAALVTLLILPGMAAAQAPAGTPAPPAAQQEHPATPPAAAPQAQPAAPQAAPTTQQPQPQCQMGPGGTCVMPGATP
jgi:hypothetical protein